MQDVGLISLVFRLRYGPLPQQITLTCFLPPRSETLLTLAPQRALTCYLCLNYSFALQMVLRRLIGSSRNLTFSKQDTIKICDRSARQLDG